MKLTGHYIGIGYRTGKNLFSELPERTLLRQEIMTAQTKVVKVEKSKNWLNLGYFLKVEPIGSPRKL